MPEICRAGEYGRGGQQGEAGTCGCRRRRTCTHTAHLAASTGPAVKLPMLTCSQCPTATSCWVLACSSLSQAGGAPARCPVAAPNLAVIVDERLGQGLGVVVGRGGGVGHGGVCGGGGHACGGEHTDGRQGRAGHHAERQASVGEGPDAALRPPPNASGCARRWWARRAGMQGPALLPLPLTLALAAGGRLKAVHLPRARLRILAHPRGHAGLGVAVELWRVG